MRYEIAANPDVLCNHSISVHDMTLYGYKLQDTGASIPRDIIIDTSMEQLPQGVVSVSRREKKTYYQQNNQEIEYTLEDRITSVIQHGGWLHTVFEVSYHIAHQAIVEMRITGSALERFKDVTKLDIETTFGRADIVKEHVSTGEVMSTDFIYRDRRLLIQFDEWDHIITGINIGETLLFFENKT